MQHWLLGLIHKADQRGVQQGGPGKTQGMLIDCWGFLIGKRENNLYITQTGHLKSHRNIPYLLLSSWFSSAALPSSSSSSSTSFCCASSWWSAAPTGRLWQQWLKPLSRGRVKLRGFPPFPFSACIRSPSTSGKGP